jgi:hypothetical protein
MVGLQNVEGGYEVFAKGVVLADLVTMSRPVEKCPQDEHV